LKVPSRAQGYYGVIPLRSNFSDYYHQNVVAVIVVVVVVEVVII
jgi:hypothetical protein